MRRSTVVWRWRRNPLRGRSYALEGWILVALGAVVLVGAALAGSAVAKGLDDRYTRQRHERHTVSAVLTGNAGDPVGYGAPPQANVRWTLPGGAVRTGVMRVSAGLTRGEHVTIWLDRRGRPVMKPPSAAAGLREAVIAGTAAGLGVCAGGLAGGRITAAYLDRRRVERWGAEWARVGPRWNHRDA